MKLQDLFDINDVKREVLIVKTRKRIIKTIKEHYQLRKRLKIKLFEEYFYYNRYTRENSETKK